MRRMKIPVIYSGFVYIDCPKQEFIKNGATSGIIDKAMEEAEKIELIGELDLQGFDFKDVCWLEK